MFLYNIGQLCTVVQAKSKYNVLNICVRSVGGNKVFIKSFIACDVISVVRTALTKFKRKMQIHLNRQTNTTGLLVYRLAALPGEDEPSLCLVHAEISQVSLVDLPHQDLVVRRHGAHLLPLHPAALRLQLQLLRLGHPAKAYR